MNSNQVWGSLRPIIAGGVGYAVGHGLLPEALQGPTTDFLVAAVPVLALSAWSAAASRLPNLAAILAGASGTSVQGNAIVLHEQELVKAAQANATNTKGQ